MNVYYKSSTDSGTTWGAETVFSPNVRNRKTMFACPRFTGGYFFQAQVNQTTAGQLLLAASYNLATGSGSASIIGG
jgi:hypothetical protein